MSSDGSVTHLLGMLQAGNRNAVQPLWDRYFHQLVACARSALRGAPRRAADEEDVALSAFECFCRGVEEGRFPRLGDRDDLRRLLLMITACKAAHQARDENCIKRGGGKVSAASDLPGGNDGEAVLEQAISREPTPEFAFQVADECKRLLDKLDDENLRMIALWRMEGYTVEEIAVRIGRSPRRVASKLAQIRELWRGEVPG
jgi:DNA-directed RNA polymerase specialized sigma24 family protein